MLGSFWRSFEALLPKAPTQLGTVQSISGDRYNVLLDGGGVLQCTASQTWSIGARVLCIGQRIEGEGPDLPQVTYEI